MVREAGRLVGEVLATVVAWSTPRPRHRRRPRRDPLVTGVRECSTATRSRRATRHLEVTDQRLGPQSAVTGAHAMVIDEVYSPSAVDAELARVGV